MFCDKAHKERSICGYIFHSTLLFENMYLTSRLIFTAATFAASNALENIIETGKRDGGFETLLAGIEAANLTDILSGNGTYTVFAPTDAAFDEFPEGLLDCLVRPEQKDTLTNILLYHVLNAEVTSDELTDGMMAMTMNGANVTIGVNGSEYMVNDAYVNDTDVMATNGVIHVIDSVLIPPYFNTDSFMVECYANIVNVLEAIANREDPNLTVLLKGLQETDILEGLKGEGPYTVFAQIDSAFDPVPMKCLVEKHNNTLATIMKYHIGWGKVISDQVSDGQVVTSWNGANLTLGVSEEGVTVQAAKVIFPDILVSNGVIHMVDSVMLPKDIDLDTLDCEGVDTSSSSSDESSSSSDESSSSSDKSSSSSDNGPMCAQCPKVNTYQWPDGWGQNAAADIATFKGNKEIAEMVDCVCMNCKNLVLLWPANADGKACKVADEVINAEKPDDDSISSTLSMASLTVVILIALPLALL